MPDPNSPDGPNGIFVLPSAKVDHITTRLLDVAYAGESDFQKLDLYMPDGQAPRGGWPLIIFVHGGAWMMCDKSDIQVMAPLGLRDQGFAVASVNYRLSGEARFPAQIYDLKAAIRYLRAEAAPLGLDATRFALWGCSAGGHLVELAAMTNGVPLLEDLAMGHAEASSDVQALVSFFGPTKLDDMDMYMSQTGAGEPDHDDAQSPEGRLLGGAPSERPGMVIAANPETWVTKDCPPSFLLHAPADPIVPVQHSIMLAHRISRIAGQERVRLRLVENAGHATPEFDVPEVMSQVALFLEEALFLTAVSGDC